MTQTSTATQTAGQALAAELRKSFRIGTRTHRYGKIFGARTDLHAAMIEAIETSARYPGYYSAERSAVFAAANAVAASYRKHVDGYRIDGHLAFVINGLSAYQFAALLGRMVDAGVSNVGEGEIFFDAMTREIRTAG
jgi:hypothetical protein